MLRDPRLDPRPFDVVQIGPGSSVGASCSTRLLVCIGLAAAQSDPAIDVLVFGAFALAPRSPASRRFNLAAWHELASEGVVLQVAVEGVEDGTGRVLWTPPPDGYDYGLPERAVNMKGWKRGPAEHYPA